MGFAKPHEIHRRRFGRNLGLSLTLGGLVVVIFGITIAKIAGGSLLQAYDHAPRASALPVSEGTP